MGINIEEDKILQIIPCARHMNKIFRYKDNNKIFKVPILGFALYDDGCGNRYIAPFEFEDDRGVIQEISEDYPDSEFIKYEMEDMKGEEDNADTCE